MESHLYITYKCIKPTILIDDIIPPEFTIKRTTQQLDPLISDINSFFQNEDVKIASYPIRSIINKLELHPEYLNTIIYKDLESAVKSLNVPQTKDLHYIPNLDEFIDILDINEPSQYKTHQFYISKLDDKLSCSRIDILSYIYKDVYILKSIFQYPNDQKFYIVCNQIENNEIPYFILPTNIKNIIDILYLHYSHIYTIAKLANALLHDSLIPIVGTDVPIKDEYAFYIKSLIQRLKHLKIELE